MYAYMYGIDAKENLKEDLWWYGRWENFKEGLWLVDGWMTHYNAEDGDQMPVGQCLTLYSSHHLSANSRQFQLLFDGQFHA